MVWFDCQCGESLKKPSVAKHLLHKHCAFVTCVDCSTTFHGSEYEGHIKCISEAQKYMGSMFHSEGGKKEGAKQDDWLAAVSSALAAYQGPLRHLADRLSQYDNIPRKQKAFENFVANSLTLKWDPATVTKLWHIVEPCLKRTGDVNPSMKTAPLPWKSYEEEAVDIMKRNGGSMPWKLLQANLAKRRKTVHPEEDYDLIRLNVLANIPDRFLSESSNLVSM